MSLDMDDLFDQARQQAKGRREPYKEPSMDQMFEKARTSAVQKDQQKDQQNKAAQQRTQTIQSMQTKKAELDERKLAPTPTSYVSPAPIVWTLDSAVSPIIKQNSKVSQQYATAMPNTSLIQQATENYGKWNQQYEQDQDQYLDDVDRVSMLSGMGTSDAEANRRLEQSSEKLSQTHAQWNETMRQTLDMLGPGTENLIRSWVKDAQDKRVISGENDLTAEDKEKYQRSLKVQELSKLLGSELFKEVTEYVRQQENAIRMQRKVDAASGIADEHGIVASINSVPKKIVGGVAGVLDKYAQGVDRLFSGSHAPLDWNTEFQIPGREANAIRSTVSQNIREDTGGEFWPFIYNTGMSMADSAAVMPLGGWGSVVLGAASFNDSAQEAKARGASDDQAMALGLISGVTEVLTEKVSIDSLFNLESPKKITDILWNAAKQAIPEASEEAISEIVGSIADVIIMGDKSGFKTKMREYERRGYNRDQAAAMALGNSAGDVLLSAAGGALSGFAFGAIKSTGDYAINKISDFSNKINEIVETDQPQYRTNINITEQQNAQAQTRQDARQNATAMDFAQEQPTQRTIDPSGYRQTAQQILNENIFESQTYGTAMEETELTRGEVRQALRDIARGNQSKVTDSNVQTVLQAIQAVENNLPASETTQVQEARQPQQTQERQQIIPDDTAREQLNEAQLGALRDLAQQNTQAQTRQDARQNATATDFAQEQPGLEQTMQEPQTAKAPLSERAQQLAQRMAELGEDGETAVELARDIEGYFWGDVEDEATVQRLANNPAAVTVMEQLMDQGIRPSIETQAEEGQQTAQDQNQQDQLNGPILDTLQELDRQKRAANARNETERTGILAGATTEQIEQAQRIGELVGREVAFFAEGKDASGGLKNGYFNQKDGRIYVNVNSQNQIAQIVSHELTHSVEGNTFYNKLRQAVLKKIKADGVNLNTLRTEKQALYERHGVTDVDVDAEIVAEYVEKNLLTDEESIRRLVLENRTLGQRIMEFIDKLLAKLGNKKAQEREFLSKARRYYADALAESQASGTFGQQERVRSMERLQEQMASGELTEDEAWQVFNEIYDAELDLQNGLRGNQYSYSPESTDVDTETSRKEQQFEIIQNSNAAEDDYHTWIRDASDQGEYVFYDVTDIKPTSFQTRTEPSTAAAGISTVSAIQEDSVADRIAENAASVKGKFSISEEENLSDLDREQLAALESMKEDTRQAETEQLRQALPVKARQYLARAERVLLANVQNALGVDKFSDKAGLMGTIQEISNEYLKHGKLTQERADALFEKAYKQGIVVKKEFYERYKGIKDKLRTTAVTLDPGYASSIPDVKDFRQAAFGRLRLVKEGGMSVDSLYQELQQQAPELFPADIANPADQLVRMFDVAKSIQISERNVADSMGRDAQDFKRWAKNDFDAAIADVASKLRNVNRYAQERAEKANAKKVPSTPQEAAKAYRELKNARWTMEKAKAKTLLTDADRMQVGRLLRGEIELSDLKPGKDNVQGIGFVYEASKEYDGLVKLLNKYKAQMRQNMQKKAAEYLKDAMDWKDKTAGILYSRETMERNIQDIAPDAQTADAVIKEYITPVHKSEAESTRFKNRYRDRVRALDLSQKVQKGNNVSEAYAVQLLGEAQDNIQRIENSKGRIKKRDGETAKTWKNIVNALKKENPNLDWAKVENAVAEFRSIYNELFQQANEVRVRNGYEPVNYRGGYFPHFQAQGDSLLTRIGHAIGIDTQVQTLPTSINGITGEFKPGTTWFKFGQQRKGHQTAYDAVAGFEQYIESVAPVIYQTDNIQNLRALATEIRRMTGDEGIRQQIDAIQMDQTLTEDEKRAKLEDVYKNGQYTLSNFVNELDEYTNLLANKKSKLDRSMEAMIGRRAYTIMKNFESRVGANMVAGNLASAFTNFVPLVQAWGQIDSGTLLHGMWDTLKAYKNDDGFVDQSTFLTNRRGSDPIIQTWTQKASKVAGTPMEYIDNFTSDSIVRARFRQNLRRGMSETLAMEEADAFAARVMADRSKGSMPTLFSSNNPIIKAFTQFQLEVNNQFSEVFKDLPRAYKDKGLAALTAALLKYFFGAYIYNEVYEKIVGRRPALDPFGILNDMVGDLTGYELPNLVTLAGNAIQGKETSFETEKVGLGEAGKNLTENVLGTLPFSSGLALVGVDLDGGRIPASSAIPDLTALWDAATTDEWSGKKRWNEAQQELNKLAYIIPPFGGSQFSKGVKTIKQLTNRGKYTVDAEGNDVLQYPIDDSLDNWVRSALFGTSSLPESQEYYDSGNKALTGEQTAVVRELEEQGVDQKTMYNLYQTLRQIGKEKKGAEASNAKRDAINALDLSDEQKLNVFDATMLDNKLNLKLKYQLMLISGLSWDEITRADNTYAKLKEEKGLTSSERARKMELWIDDQGWTEDQQEAVKSHIGVGQAAKGEGAYEYMKERIGNGTPPETVLQALTDAQQKNYSEYIQKANVSAEMYLDALSFASKAESDKDEDGKTISGSRKKKIVDWINSQKLTKKQKRALFLCFYSESDNTFK